MEHGLDAQMVSLACFGCPNKEDCQKELNTKNEECKKRYDEACCFWKNVFCSAGPNVENNCVKPEMVDGMDVIVCETNDTSWGLDDRYNLLNDKHEEVKSNLSIEEIQKVIDDYHCNVIGGDKYL